MRDKIANIEFINDDFTFAEGGKFNFTKQGLDKLSLAIREEIEKAEIPESPEKMPTDKYDDAIADKIIAFEYGAKMYRQKILTLFK